MCSCVRSILNDTYIYLNLERWVRRFVVVVFVLFYIFAALSHLEMLPRKNRLRQHHVTQSHHHHRKMMVRMMKRKRKRLVMAVKKKNKKKRKENKPVSSLEVLSDLNYWFIRRLSLRTTVAVSWQRWTSYNAISAYLLQLHSGRPRSYRMIS